MGKLVFTLALSFVLKLGLEAQAGILKMEPPYWWVGMEHQELQIMLYGDDVGERYPMIEDNNLEVQKVVRVENPNYLFIYLDISQQAEEGVYDIFLRQKDKDDILIKYELKQRKSYAQSRQGFGPEDVVYLVTPDRFSNGNINNDKIPEMLDQSGREYKFGRHGGDLQGIINHLDYIDGMGFTCLWLNPVLENNMAESSYHGYAITDYYRVDPRYGTNDLYRELVHEANKRGISVIIDMVMNHCGNEHWFVKDPPSLDWINFRGEYVNTSHRRHTNQDLYASQYDKKKFSDGWFVESMPDLNQNNELLGDYLIQNSIWWIEDSGASGIRMDTHPYPDKIFMSRWSKKLLKEYPLLSMVGEEWSPQPAIVAYWQKGKNNHDGFVSVMPSMMDFPLQTVLKEGLLRPEESWESGMIPMYEMLALDFVYPNPSRLMVFADNHDMDRVFTQLGEDVSLTKIALGYVLTMRGIPQIFYGTEILMSNKGAPHDHGIIRSDFPGGWEADSIDAFTAKNLTVEELEFQNWLRKLLKWRKGASVIHTGKLMQFAPHNGIYTYFRYSKKEVVMVAINKNEVASKLPLEDYREILFAKRSAKEVVSGKTYSMDKSIIVPPRSISIFEIELP